MGKAPGDFRSLLTPRLTPPRLFISSLRLLTPCENLCALPSMAAEVALEGSKLRILLLQGSDIRLVAHVVEPPILDGELFAHLLLELVPGHLVVANPPPYDAAEGFGYL